MKRTKWNQNKTKTSSDLRQMHLFVVPHFSLTYQRFYLYLTDDLRRLFINTKIWCVYGFISYHKHIEYRIVLKLQRDSPHSFPHVFLHTRNLYRINSLKVWCYNYNVFFSLRAIDTYMLSKNARDLRWLICCHECRSQST